MVRGAGTSAAKVSLLMEHVGKTSRWVGLAPEYVAKHSDALHWFLIVLPRSYQGQLDLELIVRLSEV